MKKIQIRFQCPNGLEVFCKSTVRTEETVVEAKAFIQQIIDSKFEGIFVEHSDIIYIPRKILKKCIITIMHYET